MSDQPLTETDVVEIVAKVIRGHFKRECHGGQMTYLTAQSWRTDPRDVAVEVVAALKRNDVVTPPEQTGESR